MDYSHTSPHMSPSAASSAPVEPKTVRFQLISPDSPHTTARLPMRVQIYPHDATDSIVTTVKNFYGLYSSPTSSKGVSFEDEAGNTMIARYENFRNNMVVYVRVIEEPALSPSGFASRNYRSPPAVGDGSNSGMPYSNGGDSGHASANGYFSGHGASSLQHFHHLQEQHGEYISRPGSRTSRKRSVSPNSNRGRRSVSASTNSKNRSRSSKNRQHSDAFGPDSMAGYSSGDGAPGSNNGRSKEQQPIGNTDISLENIVEGGRRKRAKFESSELPLFAPPQMPAATSNPSVSPARRSDHRPSLPYVHPGQNPFSGAGALHSPQHYNTHFGQGGVYATPGSDGRRTRASIGYPNAGANVGMGVLPTPDPTVSSMSEEDKDVAMQLMRLGEISNMSYGRTSTSTQDDTFSGRADAASSTGATSDSESESNSENSEDYDDGEDEVAPPHRKQRLDLDGASRKIYQSVEPADDDSADYKDGIQMPGLMAAPKLKKVTKANATNGAPKQARPQSSAAPKAKPKTSKAKATNNSMQFPGTNGTTATTTNGAAKSKKANGTTTAVNVPMSPASLPPSRKLSVSSTGGLLPIVAGPGAIAGPGGLGDEDIADLSSKPRCQRCRKSKKGCDRQRPCGRCRDAGIPAELCISEDEGNGRKGRYGRHMGVPVKNNAGGASSTSMQPPPPPQQLQQQPQQVPVSQPRQHQPQPAHSYVPTAIPSPSHQAPPMHATIQQNAITPQLQQLQQILPPQVLSQPQPTLPMKTLPALLPPAHISSTPIIAPTIPALMAASSEKNKKRKR